MIRREGNTIRIQGVVNIHNVVDLTQQGIIQLENESVDNSVLFDLEQVTEVDSTAVSMLFEWLRAANQRQCRIEFVHLPANLESLIQLYGVTDIITTQSCS